jgi:hypothetical protein
MNSNIQLPSNFQIPNLKHMNEAMLNINKQLSKDLVLKRVSERLKDVNLISKLHESNVQEGKQLGESTIRVRRAFDGAKNQLNELQDRREPWSSRWQTLINVNPMFIGGDVP